MVGGARSFAVIGQWVADADADLRAALGLRRGCGPSESAIRRAFARLDATKLDAILAAWLWTRTVVVDQRRVIALDGKTVRGARTRDRAAPHLVAAFDHDSGAVLGQLAVTAKSNEIPAARTLLGGLDLDGVVVTVDAMHTQTDTAHLIVEAGGDYVFTVKGNQPSLYAVCKALPWHDVPARRVTSKGHGRRATRTIRVVTAPAWVQFQGRRPGRPAAQNRYHVEEEDRRGRLSHHLRRCIDRVTGDARDLGARALGHRESSPLGSGCDLRRRPLPDPYRLGTAGHGHPAEPRHQPAPYRRLDQHRPRPPTSRRRHTAPARTPDVTIRDFAGALLAEASAAWEVYEPQ